MLRIDVDQPKLLIAEAWRGSRPDSIKLNWN